ncbi:MAG: hypothetical protein WCS43_18980 [Verrucomicrobiota bacterium]
MRSPEEITEIVGPIAGAVVFMMIVAGIARSAASGQVSGTLVIKAWKANNQPVDAEGNYVSITGRQGGLIAWVLSVLGVDPITTFKVSPERVEISRASLSGTDFIMIPILSVCSTHYGYYNPWKPALAVFVVFASMSIAFSEVSGFGAFILFLVGLGLAFLIFVLGRALTVGIVEHSGVRHGIRFKRSVIEGVDINQAQGAYICRIIQFLIESRRSKLGGGTVP